VNDIDECYRLKLFMERFSIKSAVLNSELPQAARNHIILSFNHGAFDYLIATDENLFVIRNNKDAENDKQQKLSKKKKDLEYLVSRGVDFKFVKAGLLSSLSFLSSW
jgi:ATP-dependent RNA helicase DDX56/DBP9